MPFHILEDQILLKRACDCPVELLFAASSHDWFHDWWILSSAFPTNAKLIKISLVVIIQIRENQILVKYQTAQGELFSSLQHPSDGGYRRFAGRDKQLSLNASIKERWVLIVSPFDEDVFLKDLVASEIPQNWCSSILVYSNISYFWMKNEWGHWLYCTFK